jgi:ParB-like nuclease domain
MPNLVPALLPSPALFDVTTVAAKDPEGTIERVPLDRLELAPNARRDISPDGLARLAAMLMRAGQLVPCIGCRPDPATARTVIYAGQRRLLAAQDSQQLAGTDGYEGLAPIRSLIVLLLDHEPGAEEIRRIQAHENARESLSMVDQQDQFRDCWQARAGLREQDRVAAVCADLGISPKKAHNLRRQLTLPEPIRLRVAERPSGEQISVTLAARLADMHEIAPELTSAVAQRITTTELHERALRDLSAFVHRTVVEDEHTYAVRIDDGALLDGAGQIEHARTHLAPAAQHQAAGVLGCHTLEQLDSELDTLTARAKTKALKVRIDGDLRERARARRYAYVHARGPDFAPGAWVIDPVFMLDVIHEQLKHADDATQSTVDLTAHRGESGLDDLDLGDDEQPAAT